MYRARDTVSGALVAVKIIDLELSSEELLAVQREINVLAHVRTPYVTAYYDSFLCDANLWIVMEYCAGGSCADLVRTPRVHDAS